MKTLCYDRSKCYKYKDISSIMEQIDAYIQQGRKQGQTDEQIRLSLITAGWNAEQVNSALVSPDVQGVPSPSQTAGPTPVNQPTKVSLNPVAHFINGNKDLFSTNATSAILTSLIAAVLGFGISLLFILLLSSSLKDFITGLNVGLSKSTIISLIIKLLAFWLITSVISGYFYELMSRAVLTGTRREHVSFGSLFPFVAKRFVLALLTALMVGGVFLAVIGVTVLAAIIQPFLAVLVGVIGAIFLLIFAFRMSYTFYIAADNEQPKSARWILRRSSALWKRSGGALITYFFTLGTIIFLFQLLAKSGSSNLQSSSTANSHSAIAYGSLLATALVEGVLGLLVSAAVGNIYNQAKQIVDSNNSLLQNSMSSLSGQTTNYDTGFAKPPKESKGIKRFLMAIIIIVSIFVLVAAAGIYYSLSS
jgi:hypothetical protein